MPEPPGRGAPGRGPPFPEPPGRGIPWEEAYGLLPGRGPPGRGLPGRAWRDPSPRRGAGLGADPSAPLRPVGFGEPSGFLPRGLDVASLLRAPGLGAPGLGMSALGEGALGAATVEACSAGALAAAGFFGIGLAAPGLGAGLFSAFLFVLGAAVNFSRICRTTGGSSEDEDDLTNSPASFR